MVDFCVLVYALDSKLSAEVFCLRRNAAGWDGRETEANFSNIGKATLIVWS